MLSNASKIQVNKPQLLYWFSISITNTSTYLCQALWLWWWCHCCAQCLQDWFVTSACMMIAKAGHPVEWITPFGMPVVQPYHKRSYERSQSNCSFVFSIYTICLLPFTPVTAHSTPLNYVHSLDSTQLMLTSLYSKRSNTMINCMCSKFWYGLCTIIMKNKMWVFVMGLSHLSVHKSFMLPAYIKALAYSYVSTVASVHCSPPQQLSIKIKCYRLGNACPAC